MLSVSLLSGQPRNTGAGMADLTSLAVQATNLRAGVATAGADGKAQERGPAVVISPTLAQTAAASTPAADDAGASAGEDLGGRGNPGEGLRFLAEAMGEGVVQFSLRLANARETLRIYQETGELYSIQPTGKYRMDPESQEGKAQLASVARIVEKMPSIIEEQMASTARAQESYRNYMTHLKAHAASDGR